MIAFGAKPSSPTLPRITTTIGAMARIGTVCDAMIHGKMLRSSVRECTIRIASSAPEQCAEHETAERRRAGDHRVIHQTAR